MTAARSLISRAVTTDRAYAASERQIFSSTLKTLSPSLTLHWTRSKRPWRPSLIKKPDHQGKEIPVYQPPPPSGAVRTAGQSHAPGCACAFESHSQFFPPSDPGARKVTPIACPATRMPIHSTLRRFSNRSPHTLTVPGKSRGDQRPTKTWRGASRSPEPSLLSQT